MCIRFFFWLIISFCVWIFSNFSLKHKFFLKDLNLRSLSIANWCLSFCLNSIIFVCLQNKKFNYFCLRFKKKKIVILRVEFFFFLFFKVTQHTSLNGSPKKKEKVLPQKKRLKKQKRVFEFKKTKNKKKIKKKRKEGPRSNRIQIENILFK